MAIYMFEDTQPSISPSAFVHPSAVLIGDVVVGEGCYIGPGASLRGDFGSIVIEPESNLQDNCVMHGTIGSKTVIHRRGHVGHGAIVHGCTIGEDVLVGMNAVVMNGCVIGAGSIIGACSMVRAGSTCEQASLLVGAPAKLIRHLNERDFRKKREATQRYIDLAKRCHTGLKQC